MPKLPADIAAEAEEAASEDGGPAPLPEGTYIGKLTEVVPSEKEGPSGYHYWRWVFKVQDDGYKGKELSMITSLSPNARFAFGGAFAAFGVPTDTHTDELLGQMVRLAVTISVIDKGARQGQKTNRVDYALPLEDGDATGQSPLDEDF